MQPANTGSFCRDGTRSRVFATLQLSSGRAGIFLDGQLVFTADLAALPHAFKDQIGGARLPNQLIFDSGPLESTSHKLEVVVQDRLAPDKGVGVALEAFDYIGADAPPH